MFVTNAPKNFVGLAFARLPRPPPRAQPQPATPISMLWEWPTEPMRKCNQTESLRITRVHTLSHPLLATPLPQSSKGRLPGSITVTIEQINKMPDLGTGISTPLRKVWDAEVPFSSSGRFPRRRRKKREKEAFGNSVSIFGANSSVRDLRAPAQGRSSGYDRFSLAPHSRALITDHDERIAREWRLLRLARRAGEVPMPLDHKAVTTSSSSPPLPVDRQLFSGNLRVYQTRTAAVLGTT